MNTIKLPKHASFEVKLDGSVYDTHKVRDNHIAYTENAREVIFSAATIEAMLKDYVTNFFVVDMRSSRNFRRNFGRILNPNGIPSLSPGLIRNAGLPWVIVP